MPQIAFPLNLRFKILAVSPIIEVTDARGNYVCYVKQKLFKLKERIEVFTDPSRTQLLCEINANKVIDFSATYTFTDPQGNPFGAIRRRGMRSIWRAHFEILDPSGQTIIYELREDNPWVKVMDGIFGDIPIIGILSGYVFQPKYNITHPASGGTLCYQLQKEPAFMEGKFTMNEIHPCNDDIVLLIGILMAALLERNRG